VWVALRSDRLKKEDDDDDIQKQATVVVWHIVSVECIVEQDWKVGVRNLSDR
jgi:hypothetical protein